MPLLAIPYLLYLTPLRYHSMTGMETTLALLANALFACALVSAARRRSAAALGLCVFAGYFAFAVRPDHGLYALLLPPLFFVATDRALGKYAAKYLLLFGVVLGCDALLKTWLFGGFLPLSFFAKKSGFYLGYTGAFRWNAMEWMLGFWTTAGLGLALVIGKAPKRKVPQVMAIAVPLLATLAYYATVVQIMGFESRYYFPSLAFIVLMAGVAVQPREGETPAPASPAETWTRILIGLVVLLPAASGTLKTWATARWQQRVIGETAALTSTVTYRTPKELSLPPLDWFQAIRKMAALLERLPQDVALRPPRKATSEPTAARPDDYRPGRPARPDDRPERILPRATCSPESRTSCGSRIGITAACTPSCSTIRNLSGTTNITRAPFPHGIALRKPSEHFAAIRSEVERSSRRPMQGPGSRTTWPRPPLTHAGRFDRVAFATPRSWRREVLDWLNGRYRRHRSLDRLRFFGCGASEHRFCVEKL